MHFIKIIPIFFILELSFIVFINRQNRGNLKNQIRKKGRYINTNFEKNKYDFII